MDPRSATGALYNRIGLTYAATRQADPRIAAVIDAALADARSVVNVGAGAGAYEPDGRTVIAVEPSRRMIVQRGPRAAPAVVAVAEHLPLADNSCDAALAVNTVHHWTDLEAGLREMRRAARSRIVVFLRNPAEGAPFWLVDYVPACDASERMQTIIATIDRVLGQVRRIAVPLPADCLDGVFSAYWARPEAYLDPAVRRNMSNFALVADDIVAAGLARLARDLKTGRWDELYGRLRTRPELDLGYRVLVAECR